MKFKSLQKFAADELLFSDYLLENERKIIERGWDSFKWGFFKDNREEAIRLRDEEDNFNLYRILVDTTMLLKYTGDPQHITRLRGWEKFWRERGEDAVADALKVRIEEAEYEEPEVSVEAPINLEDDEYSFIGDEEAPLTMRSVAKAISFATIYYKLARG